MDLTHKTILKILSAVESKKISGRKAFEKLRNLSYETLSLPASPAGGPAGRQAFARLDHHRSLRKGFPEAVYAPGKTLAQLEKIIGSIRKSGQNLIVTRLEKKIYQALRKNFRDLCYSEEARIAYFQQAGVNGRPLRNPRPPKADPPLSAGGRALAGADNDEKSIAILTGGTSDLPVAEEAALTLELIGRSVIRLYDCGVAGLHRLLDQLLKLKEVKAVICVAGMEGALPSVVAGLTDKPVVAVPTSVGYGASFKGIAPLLAMLNSCSQGVAVVNIDNGFGAACFAHAVTS